jgi:hypothetical protein
VPLSGAPALLTASFGLGKAADVHAAPRAGAQKIGRDVKKFAGLVFRFVRDGGKLSPSVQFNNASS